MTASVSTTFTFTKAEYVLAMKRHYRSTLKVGRDIVGGLVTIGGGTYLLATGETGFIAWIPLAAGVVLLAMVGYAIFLLPSMLYNSQPKLKDEYTLGFSDGGIAFKTNNIDSMLQWSVYESWLADDDFYIMYHGKRELSVIPRRTLNQSEDNRLRELLTQKIGAPSA